MEEEIKQLKSVLRSLVVSSPSEMDVRTLLRDYRNMMGSHVPLNKYGYRDPLSFLKERCSDCFLFTGLPSNPTLTLIVPDTLKHIDQFVQKQKPSSTTKHKAKRRSVPQSIIEPPKTNLIADTFVCKKKVEQLEKTTKAEVKPPDIEVPKNNCGVDKIQVNGLDKDNQRIQKGQNESENRDINENNLVSEASSTALYKFLKKRTPLYDSLEHDKFNKEIEFSKDENDSGRQTLSSNNSSMKSVKLEQLKVEIRDIIAEHPEGVLCTDLLRLYRERYKKELEFSRWGYTSIVSVVCALGEAVALSRMDDTGDWLARDARAYAPSAHAHAHAHAHEHAHASAPRLRRLNQHYQRIAATPTHHAAVDVDDALPGIQYDPDVYPSDCMQFAESLPPAPLGDARAGAQLEVMVGEVYSPSHFWLMRLGDHHHIALDDMMDEMTEYYERGEGKSRALARGAVRAGQYCAAKYERDWHRALVVRELDADAVKVRLVDYGTVDETFWRELRPLPRRWSVLPQQAIRARLAGVAPRARHWPRLASRYLLRKVQQKQLVAQVAAVDVQENILEVFLVDTSGEDDVCLTSEMIRTGHAEPRDDSSLLTSECHLFPRFDALESGAAPNFGDIERYIRDGVALQYVDDYRRHVPVDLPPTPPSPPSPPSPPTTPTPPTPSTPSTPSASVPSRPPSIGFDVPITRIPLLLVEAESQTTPGPASPSSTPTPPPPPTPTVQEEVRLSLAECEMYRELSATSPMAAHWFMMGALSRALCSSSQSLQADSTDPPHVPHVPYIPHFQHMPHVPYAPHMMHEPPVMFPLHGQPMPYPHGPPMQHPHVMYGPPGPPRSVPPRHPYEPHVTPHAPHAPQRPYTPHPRPGPLPPPPGFVTPLRPNS